MFCEMNQGEVKSVSGLIVVGVVDVLRQTRFALIVLVILLGVL